MTPAMSWPEQDESSQQSSGYEKETDEKSNDEQNGSSAICVDVPARR